MFTCRTLKLDPYLLACTKLYSKCIKDLSESLETLKLLQKNTGKRIEDICKGSNFLKRTPSAQEIRVTIDEQNWIKLKNFFTSKETITRMKNSMQNRGNSLDKGLVPRIYKELKKRSSKRIIQLINL
jgi:hypothetical protein